MNRRQKKKQYKKLHGYNPPAEKLELKEMDGPIVAVDLQILQDGWRECMAIVAKALRDFAAAVSRAFGNIAKQLHQPEEPCAVTTRALTERRKTRCRRKGWRASRR